MARQNTKARRRQQLAAAKAYIGQKYRDPDLALDQVAEAAGVSKRQLQRVFREEGGQDFRSYLLHVRMEKATELLTLEVHPLSVRVAARHVGYRHASGLRQAFLRFYGYNPSAIQPTVAEYLGTTTFE